MTRMVGTLVVLAATAAAMAVADEPQAPPARTSSGATAIDPDYIPEVGDRAILYSRDAERIPLTLWCATTSRACKDFVKALLADDQATAEPADKAKDELVHLGLGTEILLTAREDVEVPGRDGEPPLTCTCFAIRVLSGPSQGKTLYTPSYYVARPIAPQPVAAAPSPPPMSPPQPPAEPAPAPGAPVSPPAEPVQQLPAEPVRLPSDPVRLPAEPVQQLPAEPVRPTVVPPAVRATPSVAAPVRTARLRVATTSEPILAPSTPRPTGRGPAGGPSGEPPRDQPAATTSLATKALAQAQELDRAGRRLEAIAAYRALWNAHPGSPDARVASVRIAALIEAMEVEAQEVRAARVLDQARLLEESGKPAMALVYLRQLVKVYPKTPSAQLAASRIKALGG